MRVCSKSLYVMDRLISVDDAFYQYVLFSLQASLSVFFSVHSHRDNVLRVVLSYHFVNAFFVF